jgi:hypothetical protein
VPVIVVLPPVAGLVLLFSAMVTRYYF